MHFAKILLIGDQMFKVIIVINSFGIYVYLLRKQHRFHVHTTSVLKFVRGRPEVVDVV